MSDQLDPATRAERATADEQREVLVEAYRTLFGCEPSNDLWYANEQPVRDRGQKFRNMLDAGAYLDAAMMLLPVEWDYCVSSEQGRGVAYVIVRGLFSPNTIAATPALALIAAILRATKGQS